MINKRILKKADFTTLIIVTIIVAVGVLIIGSATHVNLPDRGTSAFIKKQILWYLIGLVVMSIVIYFDYHIYGRFANVIYILNLAVLVVVLVMGRTTMGAQRWINLGGFSLQPSELAKLAIIITLAKHLENKEKILSIKDLFSVLLHIGIPMLLIMKQPDLGTSLVLCAICFGMIFMAGISTKLLVGMISGGMLSLPILWNFLKDYQKKRILVFLNPEQDPLGAGYHVTQSMIAIGSGRLFGKGLFQGTQNQLNFLPEQHTDFIFSVLGEEFGFVGGLVLLLLYLILLLRFVNFATRAKDVFGMLIIIGVVSMFGFHILVNIGMTVGIMPVTGLPLPFMSYGGSSLITNMMAAGLVINVAMRRHKILF